MKMRSVAAAGIAGILILGIASFVASNNTSESNPRIRVAYFPNVGHSVPIVGIEKGIFQNYLKETVIETKLFDSGPQVIESLFANSIDMAYVGPGPAINGFLNSENGNLKIISGAASGGASFIIHPDSADENFSFHNKKIAAPQIGNTQDVSLRHYLADKGLKTAERGAVL